MEASKKIQQIHAYTSEDIIHDLSYDWYCNRLAMCFSNNKVVIKTRQDDDKWVKTAQFQAHDGAVWKVKWALPEYGNLLATCSNDKSIKIWEEKRQPSSISASQNQSQSTGGNVGGGTGQKHDLSINTSNNANTGVSGINNSNSNSNNAHQGHINPNNNNNSSNSNNVNSVNVGSGQGNNNNSNSANANNNSGNNSNSNNNNNNNNNNNSNNINSHNNNNIISLSTQNTIPNTVWVQKQRLLESNESAEDIKFAPRNQQLGLVLAGAFADGSIKIFEAPDLLNLGQWQKMGDISVPCNNGINSISWSKSYFEPPMIAVGCKDATQGFQKSVENVNVVYAQQDGQLEKRQQKGQQLQMQMQQQECSYFFIYGKFQNNEWKELLRLPDGSNSANTNAANSQQQQQQQQQSQPQTPVASANANVGGQQTAGNNINNSNKEKQANPNNNNNNNNSNSNTPLLLQQQQQQQQYQYYEENGLVMRMAVNDVSWSQLNGRSYHMVAVAGKEGVKILYLNYDEQAQSVKVRKIVSVVTGVEYWRVSWNVMATMIAASDCNNVVSVWRSMPGGDEWVCVNKIGEKESQIMMDGVEEEEKFN